jgi:pSer/pThr/pTyr-binding forkhead associated (FHA) protein
VTDLVLDIAIPGTAPFRVPLPATPAPVLLGRAEDADLILTSPYVSRRHARLGAGDGSWWVEDAGSSAGLLLNGDLVTRRSPLRGGDRLRLGDVDIVVSLPPDRSSGYHVDRPQAGTINMVEGVQYNIQQRESFARQIAATRSKATTLIVIGFLMMCGGSVVFMVRCWIS